MLPRYGDLLKQEKGSRVYSENWGAEERKIVETNGPLKISEIMKDLGIKEDT